MISRIERRRKFVAHLVSWLLRRRLGGLLNGLLCGFLIRRIDWRDRGIG